MIETQQPAATIACKNEEATARLGAALSGLLRPGDTVALRGDLGAGKTALTRAVIRALTGDADEDVPSPTFTLLQVYETPDGGLVYHYDLYRLDQPDDVLELDLDDALAGGVTFIEWPDRMAGWLPRDRLDVTLTITGSTARQVTLATAGTWRERIASLKALAEG